MKEDGPKQDVEDGAARRERVRQARAVSDKEPFDFARLSMLYAPRAIPSLKTLPESMADDLEEQYYLSWSEVKTLPQAAAQLRWQSMTPEQREAEWLEERDRREAKAKAARRERVRQARAVSDKEPFDFARLREIYAPRAAPPMGGLEAYMADRFEEEYYLSWSEVKTLEEAASYLEWLNLHDST